MSGRTGVRDVCTRPGVRGSSGWRRPAGGQHHGDRARAQPVDPPRRRPGRGCAELGGQRDAGLVGLGRPAAGVPPSSEVRDLDRVVDGHRVDLGREIEVLGRDPERAPGVAGQVAALASGRTGRDVEAAVHPQGPDAGQVRAPVRVDGGQPAPVVRTTRPGERAAREAGLDLLPRHQREAVQVGQVRGIHTRIHTRSDRPVARKSSLKDGRTHPGRGIPAVARRRMV